MIFRRRGDKINSVPERRSESIQRIFLLSPAIRHDLQLVPPARITVIHRTVAYRPSYLTLQRARTWNMTMRFYFCDKCGVRVADDQVKQSLGVDKQIEGYYCAKCASPAKPEAQPAATQAEAKPAPKKSTSKIMRAIAAPKAARCRACRARYALHSVCVLSGRHLAFNYRHTISDEKPAAGARHKI